MLSATVFDDTVEIIAAVHCDKRLRKSVASLSIFFWKIVAATSTLHQGSDDYFNATVFDIIYLNHDQPKISMRIVVVGGGFGGLFTLRELEHRLGKEHELILIEPRDRFVFTPLLHEVAGGVLYQDAVTTPYDRLLHRTTHIRAFAKKIDFEKKIVYADAKYPFDIVVLAQGAKTNFFGPPIDALELKSFESAQLIRATIEQNVQKAAAILKKNPDMDVSSLLHVVIVGGGATGVEVAGECIDLLRFRISVEQIDREPIVTLVHSRNHLLHTFENFFGTMVAKKLHDKGVTLVMNAKVTAVKDTIVDIKMVHGTQKLHSSCVIWSAGIEPNTIAPFDAHVRVGRTLQLSDHPFAFAIGDAAIVEKDRLPALAQVASLQGELVARNIVRFIDGEKLEKFSFKSRGMLISVGQRYAVGKIGGIRMQGFVAWFIMRTVYLLKFKSLRQEVRMAYEYTIRLFARQRRCLAVKAVKKRFLRK